MQTTYRFPCRRTGRPATSISSNLASLPYPLNVNGTVTIEGVTFYTLGDDGGLTIAPPFGPTNLLLQMGSQLYNGSVSQPVFALGTYSLTNIPCPLCAPVQFTSNFNLSIQDMSIQDTPEPSTLFLLGPGLMLLAGFRRKYLTWTRRALALN